jgi:hypothetical protein
MSGVGSGHSSDDGTGFEKTVKPLFRASDREAMMKAFDLWAYGDVVKHATAILKAVSEGTMPCDGPWPKEKVETLSRWVDAGTPP